MDDGQIAGILSLPHVTTHKTGQAAHTGREITAKQHGQHETDACSRVSSRVRIRVHRQTWLMNTKANRLPLTDAHSFSLASQRRASKERGGEGRGEEGREGEGRGEERTSTM